MCGQRMARVFGKVFLVRFGSLLPKAKVEQTRSRFVGSIAGFVGRFQGRRRAQEQGHHQGGTDCAGPCLDTLRDRLHSLGSVSLFKAKMVFRASLQKRSRLLLNTSRGDLIFQ